MKKYVKYFCVLLFFFFLISPISAKSIDIYFFYGQGCPHCAKEEVFLKELKEKNPDLNIIKYETWYNDENAKLMKERKDELGINTVGVPFTIIGDKGICGYNEYISSQIVDLVQKEVKRTNEDTKENNEVKSTVYDVPLLGKVDVKNVSLVLISIVIGLVDGFNPCAMWVLLFLISTLIGMKNRKRMWIIGTVFLLTSAIVYMLIMLSWLKIVVSITTSVIIRNIIAAIAIIGGLVNLRSFINTKKDGCSVVNDKKRNKIFDKIKSFTKEKSLWIALIGVIGLAISVNIVELACSAGLPLVFTQIIAVNNITGISAFLYTLIYIFFFLIDDLIIFIIAMISLKVTGISTKYGKISHLIGGILMLLIGLLLILKPEWIMFNF